MSFTSKNLQTKRNSMGFMKGATLFFLGMSCILFIARAFDIVPVVPNAVQYISKVFLTNDGSNTSATGIILDGTTNGGVTITNLPNKIILGTDANGKIIASTSGDVYNFIRGLILQSVGATGADGIPGTNGTNGSTGHSVVINIVTTGSVYTNGQCAGTGNIISFYSDINNNNTYTNGVDILLGSTIMCSDGATGPKGDQGNPGTNGVNGTSIIGATVSGGVLSLQYSGVNGTGTWNLGSVQGNTGANGTNGTTGHSVVINIVTTGSVYTNGQCAGTGNIISFYSDINNNNTYTNGVDTLLGSTIMCSDGATGPKGDQGNPGTNGVNGTSIIGATVSGGILSLQYSGVNGTGTWNLGSIQGATGTNGVNGTNGSTGHSVVINIVATGSIYTNGQCAGTGNIISFYSDINNNNTYTNGVDILLGSTIMCSDGATGPKGDQGIQGNTGAKGDTGANGLPGIQGNTGAKGDTGANGLPGIQGNTGAKGDTGANGLPGIQGNTGAKGDTGATGTNGTNGAAGAKGATGDIGPTGPTGFLQAGNLYGVTPYRNGSSWVTTSRNIYNNGGNVGIGLGPILLPAYELTLSGDMMFENTTGREIKMEDANYNYGLNFSILGSNSFGQINADLGTQGGHIFIQGGAGSSFSTVMGGNGGNVYINGGIGGNGNYTQGLFGQIIMANDGGKVAIGIGQASAMLTVEGGVRPKLIPMISKDVPSYPDPCSSDQSNYPTGTIFYNVALDIVCYCNTSHVAMTTAGGSCSR